MIKKLFLLATLSVTAFAAATCPVSDKPYHDAVEAIFSGHGIVQDVIDIQQSYICLTNYILVQLTPAQRDAVIAQSFVDLQQALKDHPNPKTQTGSTNSTSGSTSLVSEGGTAQILSVAAEYGALTQTVSGQTVTVKGTLDGPLVAATRQYLLGFCPDDPSSVKLDSFCINKKTHDWLSTVSYGITFNTNSPSQSANGMVMTGGTSGGSTTATAQPVTFTASGREISAITAAFSFNPQTWRPPNTTADKAVRQKFQQAWQKAFQSPQAGTLDNLKQATAILAAQMNILLTDLGLPARPETVAQLPDTNAHKPFLDFYIKHWWPETLAQLQSDKDQGNEALFEQHLSAAIQRLYERLIAYDPTIPQRAGDILRASSRARFEVDKTIEDVLQTINSQPLVTVEYDDSRPQNQNSYSTLKVILNKGFGNNWRFTFNGAVSFNTTDQTYVPGFSTFRSAPAGVELKYSFGNLSLLGKSLGNAAVSGTYYYQDQHSPAILNVTPGTPLTGITITGLPSNATDVFAEKGPIHVGQLRFELGSGSSVKFPIAVTYSNRTELITKPELRAQVGVSYNFDGLFTNSGGH